jgi:hypothetical protein
VSPQVERYNRKIYNKLQKKYDQIAPLNDT